MKIALRDFGFLQCIGTQMGFLQPESHVLIRCTMQLSLAGCNKFMWDFVGECIIYSLNSNPADQPPWRRFIIAAQYSLANSKSHFSGALQLIVCVRSASI